MHTVWLATAMVGYREIGANTLRPGQNGRHFADDIFKCIFVNENVWIPIKFSLKFVLKGRINNIPALVQIMAWRRPGDKPLSEPMVVRLTTHICVTRPQWVNIRYWVLPSWTFGLVNPCIFVFHPQLVLKNPFKFDKLLSLPAHLGNSLPCYIL